MRYEIHVSKNIHHLPMTAGTVVWNIAPLYLSLTEHEGDGGVVVETHNTTDVEWNIATEPFTKKENVEPTQPPEQQFARYDEYNYDELLVKCFDLTLTVAFNRRPNVDSLPPIPKAVLPKTPNGTVYCVDGEKYRICKSSSGVSLLEVSNVTSKVVEKLLQRVSYLVLCNAPKPTFSEVELVLVDNGTKLMDTRRMVGMVEDGIGGIGVFFRVTEVDAPSEKPPLIPCETPNTVITDIAVLTQLPCDSYIDRTYFGVRAEDLFDYYVGQRK